MNPADIKVGKYYTLQLLCIQNAEKVIVFVTASGDHIPMRQCDFECVTPILSEPPTLVGPSPKHDPCRKFRKGDVAVVSQYKGRAIIPIDLKVGDKVKVCENEKTGDSIVTVIDHIGRRFFINPAFLELVTPVEDVEPYIVEKSNDGATIVWTVKKRDCSQGLDFRYCPGWGGNIFVSENHCRKHAEAECKRLNAEYRKEQSN